MDHSPYKYVDISIGLTEKELQNGALKILHHVRPHWQQMKLKKFLNGRTNTLIGCYEKHRKFYEADVVLIRIFGEKTDLIVDRENEKKTFLLLEKHRISPPLYAAFNNGLCYGYFRGTPLNGKLVRKENIQRLIIEEMVCLHSISLDLRADNGPCLFSMMRRFLNHVPDSFTDPEKQRRFTEHIKSKSLLCSEVDELERILTRLISPVVFCHNDLIPTNIIYDEVNEKVKFVDYEYACPNYQAFEIAEHFCGYGGVDEIDCKNYPDKTYQLNWLRCFLKYWKKRQDHHENDVTEKDVETLYVTVNKFSLAVHLLWGIWALVQEKHSVIDFDFLGFGISRFSEYFAKKDECFSLEMPQ